MTDARTRYAGRSITFATMHGKERFAQQSFSDVLGAIVTAPPGLDTDQLGTFAGDIPRTLSPRDAARTKARLGMQIAGSALGLASEGSFSSGFTPSVEHMEILMLIDDDLGLEIVEGVISTSPLPGGRRIHTADDALRFAAAAGFPEQGVIVQGFDADHPAIVKNLASVDDLREAVTALLAGGSAVVILPDYRAHRAPSREGIIRTLCHRMAVRLATPCPACNAPGFGDVDVERGVPCAFCGSPTRVIAADLQGCGRCSHRGRVQRTEIVANPRWCDYCNP